MPAYVWEVPRRDHPGQPTIIVSCADDLSEARARLRSAENDFPECLSFAAIVSWVDQEPPAHQATTDDIALAICADLYV